MRCKQGQQVWGLFFEPHPFGYVSFLLVSADLGRRWAALGRARGIVGVLLMVEDLEIIVCYFLGGFRNALCILVV